MERVALTLGMWALVSTLAACPKAPEAPPVPQAKRWSPPQRDPLCEPGGVVPHGCMLAIEGGEFLMGAQSKDERAPNHHPAAREDEGPPRDVTVRPLMMHRLEVMVWQMRDCVHDGGCRADDVRSGGFYYTYGREGRAEWPVNGVSWRGARDYCAWIEARLPTEAEWEIAARGTSGRLYPWGHARPSCTRAIFGGRACSDGPSQDLRERGASEAGVLHLAGNLWEWTADEYGDGPRRSIRGGGWSDEDPHELRGTARASLPPEMRNQDVGFRCVRERDAGGP